MSSSWPLSLTLQISSLQRTQSFLILFGFHSYCSLSTDGVIFNRVIPQNCLLITMPTASHMQLLQIPSSFYIKGISCNYHWHLPALTSAVIVAGNPCKSWCFPIFIIGFFLSIPLIPSLYTPHTFPSQSLNPFKYLQCIIKDADQFILSSTFLVTTALSI